MISSAELRNRFLEFFQARGHTIVPSSSLVPANDPSLLFTNAGMVQFKEVFLGREQRPYIRAVTSQRCVRAGGKHNDLENVGYTARHHTFFEMLGNFSFGDYFKEEAIRFAWEFLVDNLELPPEKLWVTVFEEDREAEQIWLDTIGIDPTRFSRIGAKDNFWSMGDTGPCGPCSEIFYDHGPEVPGGPPGSPDDDGDRYIEIWNLVFMQYDRSADGILTPLPKPSVDTGMGLERLAAVLQGVHSNYEIDLFRHLIEAVATVTGTQDLTHNSLKVIADHIRSTAFLIVDGVLPSNEGRGYVLRRIMRRAIRHGHKLDANTTFLYKLVAPLVAEMGSAYPELRRAEDQVTRVILQEEERFAETLENGLRLLEQDIQNLHDTVIPGDTVFRLYDTYGFPVDLTADIARERNLTLDMPGFEQAMEAQRRRARAASQFGMQQDGTLAVEGHTEFTGYQHLEEQAVITRLFHEGQAIQTLEEGQEGLVVLERTPFYAESGGQVGDAGSLTAETGKFQVTDTRKQGEGAVIHIGRLQRGRLQVGDQVSAQVDIERRQATALNHSATHLLHAALRKVLGPHVSQKGSLVDSQRLRFDFSHYDPLTVEQLAEIEALVNGWVRANVAVETEIMPIDQALQSGALALFGEKYAEQVRVLSMGTYSTELCGGTHVQRLGDIGLFKIVSESGVAAGIRRIEAVTGATALRYFDALQGQVQEIAELLKGDRDGVEDKVRQLLEKNRRLEKEVEQLKSRLASSQGSELVDQATEIAGIKVLAAQLEGADAKTLRDTVDQLKNKLKKAAIVLAATEDGKIRLVAGVTSGETGRIKAGELVNAVAQQVGGKGGGRADLAQAGGTDPTHLEAALRSVPDWVRTHLS
ncbi:MAG: alanine--tRNA ligase [Gammaproteobacteria bacterium]|nr:alanine--tRNA ligase [Gammaproteobacteria bacterium]MCP5424807.1 alanine--tRNA ligase [Gammaproteobacteria bacterium]MCP5458216.1 alanine--tRNA ligase [Gammaproteobacteria bacterium]